MTRYFAAANFWLFIGLLAYTGRTTVQTNPDYYSIYGVGRVLEGREYMTLLFGILAASVIYFVFWGATARKSNSNPTH
jgi:hypothetical protein